MADRLYDLLPAVYRTRDAQRGQPLRALLSVLEEQLESVRADIDTTYDNWFIETCEEWLVPYIGELLGIRGIRSIDSTEFSQRAFVANSLGYRRRKGTVAVVEQLGRDLTGYAARAVEYFKHMVMTAHTQHVREGGAVPALCGTIDVRSAGRLARLGTAFDVQGHTADVRHMASGRGRYNLPHLGIFLWRIDSQEISSGSAAPITGEVGWYRFHPLGHDAPLFNNRETEAHIEDLATEENVPHRLSRRDLFDEQAGTTAPRYLGDDAALVVHTELDGARTDWPVEICNLADVAGALPARRPVRGMVAVDPELGRMVFNAADVPPAVSGDFEVLVDYSYGFSGEVGAGPFDRGQSHAAQLGDDELTFVRGVSRDPSHTGEAGVRETLAEAIDEWHSYLGTLSPAEQATAVGAIALLDSRTHAAPTSVIKIPAGARLHLLGATLSRDGTEAAPLPNRVRPVVDGGFSVRGTEVAGSRTRTGGLFLNGLTCAGAIVVDSGDLERLDLANVTLEPGAAPSVAVRSASGHTNAALELRLYRCITGGVAAAGPITSATVEDSLIDAKGAALALEGAALTVLSSTVLGSTTARTLSATNAIFDGGIDVEQHQEGCLRFCYVPTGQKTPRRYRCQPDLALAGVSDDAARARVLARLRPRLTSRAFADPAYGQLAGPSELRTGAEDESEMGVFHHLMHAVREANLRAALRQYLRFGLEAGVLLES